MFIVFLLGFSLHAKQELQYQIACYGKEYHAESYACLGSETHGVARQHEEC